jgi:hypothetical protein
MTHSRNNHQSASNMQQLKTRELAALDTAAPRKRVRANRDRGGGLEIERRVDRLGFPRSRH